MLSADKANHNCQLSIIHSHFKRPSSANLLDGIKFFNQAVGNCHAVFYDKRCICHRKRHDGYRLPGLRKDVNRLYS